LLPAAEPCRTNVAGIAELPPLPEISCDEFDVHDKSDDSSESGGSKGIAQICLKQTQFSLMQFAKRMGQPNFGAFNKWKKVWVAHFLHKKHQSIILGENRLKQKRDVPLSWETVTPDVL
jgi:hypothetical protein